MNCEDDTPRVLSIQSHVVSGYVGNKSATFPLQVLGFEVDTINSVQFSNHTGYGYWKGQVLKEEDLDELYDGLERNGLNYYTHLLTGYARSASFLTGIAKHIKKLKEINPHIVYVCDPVMGDDGEMYVPQELLPVFKNEIVPLADILTPNQFEAEILTGEKINSIEDALKVIKIFHDQGIKTIALSSTELGNSEFLLAIASSISDSGKQTICQIEIPKLPAKFTGTGDLFAALFLAWWHKTSKNLQKTLENTLSTMHAILKTTVSYKGSKSSSPAGRLELRLIQSKAVIEQPIVNIFGKILKN